MKTLFLAFIATLSFSANVMAQSTPKTPEPPQTTSTSSSSYSMSIDSDDDVSSNSSVSVTISEETYKFRASFHKSKTEALKKIILERLGNENLKINGNTYLWSLNKNNDETFECKLTKGHLRIFMDKEVVSNGFYKKIEALGDELKYAISGRDSKTIAVQDAKRAQRDLERAKRDLERAQRDLERAKRDVERAKKNK